jgi:hypothetical protein
VQVGDLETEDFPTSPGQRRLLFLHAMDPTGHAQSGTRCFKVLGPLDPNALRASLHTLIERHESLRTVFPAFSTQRILQAVDVPLQVMGACRSWEEALHRALPLPFDPAVGPLMTVTIVPVAAEVLLIFRFHLLAVDGWSMEVFFRDLSALYEARDAPLQVLHVQYVDWSAWQAEQLTAVRRSELRKWWRSHLEGAPLTLDLVPLKTSRLGGMQRLVLGADIYAALTETARRWNRSNFTVLAAASALVLAARSGQNEIVLGIAATIREEPETHNVLGFFVNSLPLRIAVQGDGGFAEFAGRVAAEIADCYLHKDLPFEDVVDALAPPRTPFRSPVIQVNFAHHDAGSLGTLELAGCETEEIAYVGGSGKFELTLRTQTCDDGSLTLWAEYDGTTVDEATGLDILETYRAILTMIAADSRCEAAVLLKVARSQTVRLVTGIFAEVLGLPSVKSTDDFFALGGSSLLLPEVVARLAKTGIVIALRVLYADPRPIAIAASALGAAVAHDSRSLT